MAGLNKKEVMVGTLDQTDVIGAALWGEEGATLPTIETWDAPLVSPAYVGLGYLVEDGFTMSFGISVEGLKEHNLGVIRNIITEFDGTVTITMLQTNATNMGVMLGQSNVTTAGATAEHGSRFMAAFGPELPKPGVLAIKLKDEDRKAIVLLPHAQVKEYAEVEVTATGAVGWEVTFSALVDEYGKGIYILFDDGEVISGGGE